MTDATRPVGRPPLAEKTWRISAILSAEDVTYLDRIDSNRSNAIRRLIEEHRQMTANSITIEIINTVPEYDPYVNIAGHHSYSELWLDPRDRTVGVSQEYQTNSTSSDVWHGHVLTYKLMGHPSETDVRRDLEDNRELIARIVMGYESVWDGSNHKGTYTADARAAWDELCEILDSNPAHYVFWELSEWINEGMRSEVTAETTDDEIRAYAEEWAGLEQNYEDLVVVLDGDVDDAIRYITEYRDELRDE